MNKNTKKFLRNAVIGLKATKALSNAFGTSPTETPDVATPEDPKTVGEKDGGGGSEQQYEQSDQPNGGSLGKPTGWTARSGSYLKRRQGR